MRVRNPNDEEAWEEFYKLYSPLVYSYARSRGLSHEDAEDIRSICYRELLGALPKFDYDRERGGFKAWLRTLVNRRIIDRLRKRRERTAQGTELDGLADTSPTPEEYWDEEWNRQHLVYCIERVRTRVSTQTYRLFDLLTRRGLAVQQICAQERVTPNQVYKAKARMLKMIRDEMQWLDPDCRY